MDYQLSQKFTHKHRLENKKMQITKTLNNYTGLLLKKN